MDTQSIPVIDIGDLGRPSTLAALDAACRDWGFFQVVGHDLPPTVEEALRQQMRRFFAQPRAVRQQVSRSAENPWGYYDQELTKNTLDWKQVYDYGPADGDRLRPRWPDLPGFRNAILDYYGACEALALRLLAAVSTNLGMPAAYLAEGFVPRHTSFVRLNYYPPCPVPARPEGLDTPASGHLGINHHTDAGALTILWQDAQPGLEVYRDGSWYLVEPRADALVVNIGDMVQVWSNDRYVAALHRVVADAAEERFSAPFFLNPAYAADYAPLPSTVDSAHPARYRAINWGEFRSRRHAGDYADVGVEVQIHDYLLS